ncbi:tryptophan 2,3-dioxygenase [Bordetella muralis]|jgi:tryptophan 2,3-dioxygenase|uniref:tryptophan 2,3-dioxygenase n=1 Tax=Bordetella muralis TaxID=1649130 RepID=UPI0039EF14FB
MNTATVQECETSSKEVPDSDLSNRMSYSGYLDLERLLAAQKPLSESPDEMLFIIQHQTTELWMKLIIHELSSVIAAIGQNHVGLACKRLLRVSRVFEQLNDAWDVLRTMTPSEFLRFRGALGQSSGFQSWQYRALEFLAGNRDLARLSPYTNDRYASTRLREILNEPSLYDESIRLLARSGFEIGLNGERESWSERRPPNETVLRAWKTVYDAPDSYWQLYLLAEQLIDFEDQFRRWRVNHVSTVERVIGMKRGTGGTDGVSYLRRGLDIVLFPELWQVRTQLEAGADH